MGEFVAADKFQPEEVKPIRRSSMGRGIWLVYLGCAGMWLGSYLHNLGAVIYSLIVVNGAVALILLGTIWIARHRRMLKSADDLALEAEQKRRLENMNKWSK
jgi:hypothetical protein